MKILLLCLVATLAMAQDEMDMNDTMMDMGQELSQARIEALNNIQSNYDQLMSVRARRAHLFCLNRTTNEGQVNITEFEQRGAYVWTLYLQMPLMTFLDPQRKLSLMDTVLKILDNDDYELDDICLGTYETYELSYFEESLLIRVYSRDPSRPIMASNWATAFNDQIDTLVDDDSNGYVIRYPGQSDVIALNFSTSSEYTNLILPAVETDEGVDLSSLAVFIGSYPFNITFTDGTNSSVSRQFNSDDRQRSRASNTNPINYGLEPGDIVFAVIGSILLTIVGGLIILGYCIHPFFLA